MTDIVIVNNVYPLPPLVLQCRPDTWRETVWHDDPIMIKFFKEGVDTQDDDLRHLISELDRRFVQMWDKRMHESKAEEVEQQVVLIDAKDLSRVQLRPLRRLYQSDSDKYTMEKLEKDNNLKAGTLDSALMADFYAKR